MKVLVAYECSGIVREAFRLKGHDAYSCDIKPAEDHSIFHIQNDVFKIIEQEDWDLVIAHPPCTYVCASGIHWNKRRPERQKLTDEAVMHVKNLFELLRRRFVPHYAIENPVGILSSQIRKPDQVIQPYQFGENASKATCLWLHNLPKLNPTNYVLPRFVNGKKRWGNQTDSGQNRLLPNEQRATNRARTYKGIANAMATQWGIYNENVLHWS